MGEQWVLMLLVALEGNAGWFKQAPSLQGVRSWKHIAEEKSLYACLGISPRIHYWVASGAGYWFGRAFGPGQYSPLYVFVTWCIWAFLPAISCDVSFGGRSFVTPWHPPRRVGMGSHPVPPVVSFCPGFARADAAMFSLPCYLLTLYQQVKNIPCKVLG